MIYARIVKGEVVNRAVFDDALPDGWLDRDQWHEATDNMQIGARLARGGYVMPVKAGDIIDPDPRIAGWAAITAEIDELKAKVAEQDTKLTSLSSTETLTK